MNYRYAKLIVDAFERDPYEGVVVMYPTSQGIRTAVVKSSRYEPVLKETIIFLPYGKNDTPLATAESHLTNFRKLVIPTPAPIATIERVTAKAAHFPGTGEVKHRYADGRVWVVAGGKPYIVRSEWLEAVV
jgi:hypothetical protein